MDDTTRSEYETKSQALRTELKQWETTWAKFHDGKKPSRDDIKQNSDIAAKYKSYNKLRDILSGKLPPSKPASPSRKRKPVSQPSQTPSKRLRTTPSFTRTIPLADQATTPSLNRKLFLSPTSARAPTPSSIGPTPQRDGKVLGLFDLLSGGEETPSRPRTGDFISDKEPPSGPAATPRKGGRDTGGEQQTSGSMATPAHRHGGGSRTPMSTSKRAMLDNFLLFTPLKNRDGNVTASFASRIGIATITSAGGGGTATDKENGDSGRGLTLTTPKGPGSVSKSLFATPAFLKRGHKSLDTVDESGEVEEVRPLRLPRKPLVRGLSSVVAGLRKLEEEKLDDEMEAMREMEAEMDGGGMPPPPAKRQRVDNGSMPTLGLGVGDAEVGDSQQVRPLLLGGFDDENLLDSDVEEQLDRGQPLRVYKKKGQKRTTRRVNMRPTRARRPAARPEGEDEEEEDDEEVVPETQQANGVEPDAEEDYEVMSGSDFDDEKDTTKKSRGRTGKTKTDGREGEEKEGAVKKAVRKVKATANANFKRLKLRNYGAKGGPGVNSRFRRRR